MCTAVLFAQKKQSQVAPQKYFSSAEKQWCSVIESSLAATAEDLQPAMRSLALDMIASGLKKCDPRAVRRVLIDAFLNSVAIPSTEEELEQRAQADTGFDERTQASFANLEAKRILQTDSLTHLLAEDERKVESLLHQAEPSVRTELLRQMISDAVAAN